MLALQDQHPKAHYRLGKALVGSRQLDQAVEALDNAARLAPKDAEVRGEGFNISGKSSEVCTSRLSLLMALLLLQLHAGALEAAKQELRSHRLKEGRLYADLFARGGLTEGFDSSDAPPQARPGGSALHPTGPDGLLGEQGGGLGAYKYAGTVEQVAGNGQPQGEEDEVVGLSPALEAALEAFGSQQLLGHPALRQ